MRKFRKFFITSFTRERNISFRMFPAVPDPEGVKLRQSLQGLFVVLSAWEQAQNTSNFYLL